MLKFNIKEHKLEELEKYGFVFHKRSKCYCVYGNFRNSKDLKTCSQIEIDFYEFEVYVNTDIISDNHHSVCVEFTLSDILYDLIKDGLIIKE